MNIVGRVCHGADTANAVCTNQYVFHPLYGAHRPYGEIGHWGAYTFSGRAVGADIRAQHAGNTIVSTRRKEFDEGGDTAVSNLDNVNKLGQHALARDGRVNHGPPVHCCLSPFDYHRENSVLAQLKRLNHHGQQGAELIDANSGNGDRSAVAWPSDLQFSISGENATDCCKIAAQSGGIESAQEVIDLQPVGHAVWVR
jgi:hypothetical protein